jgi:tungstate transport system ATP-binding protein
MKTTAAAAPPIVSLHGAGVRFGAREALTGVDLAIARGEFVAVVGANGAGKTTLLRALHGLVPLAAGERRLGSGPPRIAMLFQRPFLVRMSVLGNLQLALWLARVPRRERAARAEEALERAGLAAEARRPARELSVGQQQRVALARAWSLRPDLLLLDEPTASLDPAGAQDVEALLADIATRGVAVVMTTHNLTQVRRLAKRVVHLEHGRIATDADALRFFRGQVPPAVSRFLETEAAWV